MTGGFDSRFDIEYDGELPESVDERALERIEAVAFVFDESVRVPGTSFHVGIDPILGALPVAGDVVSGFFSLYIVAESAYLGVSYATLLEMLANITVDIAGGSVPVLGGVADAVWKANKRNVELALQDLAVADGEGTDTGTGSETELADGGDGVEIPVEPEG